MAMKLKKKQVIDLLLEAEKRGIHIFLEDKKLKYSTNNEFDLDPEFFLNLRRRREEIIEFLNGDEADFKSINTHVKKIERVGRLSKNKFPLSFAQERLWFIDLLQGSANYHIPVILKIEGKLDINLLEKSLQQVIDRHEVFRIVFREDDGQVFQEILEPGNWNLEYDSFQNFSNSEIGNNENLIRYVKEVLQRPFDLSTDKMLRCRLLRLSSDVHLLILVTHHIASDGWSQSLFVNEITELYQANVSNRKPILRPLAIQYADFAVWQREQFSDDFLIKKLQYWEQKLTGVEPIDLPLDYPRPAIQSTNGNAIAFSIDKDVSAKLRTLSAKEGVTLFITLLTAFKVLLYRHSGQNDICVGVPIAGRTHKELEDVIGLFVNTLAIRTNLSGNPTFKNLLHDVKSSTLEANAHQDMPFEKIVEKIERTRDMSRSPIFQVMFNLENTPAASPVIIDNLHFSHFPLNQFTSKFELSFSVDEMPNGLAIGVEYCSELFSLSTIQRIIEHYKELLNSIVSNPNAGINELKVLTSREEQQIFKEFNNTYVDYPRQKVFLDIFEDQVRSTPNNIAVKFGSDQLTYRELNHKAEQLANLLKNLNVRTEDMVPVIYHRSIELLVSLIGIFKVGGVYVPIDATYPDERKNKMLYDCAARILILSEDLCYANQLPLTEIGNLISLDFVIRKDELNKQWRLEKHICQIYDRADIESQSALTERTPRSPKDLSYVIYTSGSTGMPKGVMIEHQGMLNHLYAKINDLGLDYGSIVAQNASQMFDISIWQLLSPLMVGGRVVIYSNDEILDVENFIGQIERDNVNILEVVPSYLAALLEEIRKSNVLEEFNKLSYLIVTGEALPKNLVSTWFNLFPGTPLVNAYGPTEASDDITHAIFETCPTDDFVPIGKVVQNLNIAIVNEYMALCPIGVKGEIVVSGVGVGRGYLNNPELTYHKFTPNNIGTRGSFLYKTGDLGKWKSDGSLDYFGRIDEQVKVRGYRIELGEIEVALLRLPTVKQCVVVAGNTEQDVKRLIAYVSPHGEADKRKILDHLKTSLPDYMIPAAIIIVENLPLTLNGKVDKKALPNPDVSHLSSNEFIGPRNDIEENILAIWSEILGIDALKIGVRNNFFELGGHSLRATMLISRIDKVFNVRLSLKSIFINPTIENIANLIRSNFVLQETNQASNITQRQKLRI